MKKIFSLIFVFCLLLISASGVKAHVLKYDGTIGAVLHVTPEDDPVVGEDTGFYFEFKDKENKFLPENCDCNIKILNNDEEIISRGLFENNSAPSLTNISFNYIFPQKGIYKIIVKGKAVDGSFNDFELKYDLRVSRTSGEAKKSLLNSDNVWFFILTGLGVLLIMLLVRSKLK